MIWVVNSCGNLGSSGIGEGIEGMVVVGLERHGFGLD